jgi:hypothetical protein
MPSGGQCHASQPGPASALLLLVRKNEVEREVEQRTNKYPGESATHLAIGGLPGGRACSREPVKPDD